MKRILPTNILQKEECMINVTSVKKTVVSQYCGSDSSLKLKCSPELNMRNKT